MGQAALALPTRRRWRLPCSGAGGAAAGCNLQVVASYYVLRPGPGPGRSGCRRCPGPASCHCVIMLD